jgi:hypothetical protein
MPKLPFDTQMWLKDDLQFIIVRGGAPHPAMHHVQLHVLSSYSWFVTKALGVRSPLRRSAAGLDPGEAEYP